MDPESFSTGVRVGNRTGLLLRNVVDAGRTQGSFGHHVGRDLCRSDAIAGSLAFHGDLAFTLAENSESRGPNRVCRAHLERDDTSDESHCGRYL